MQSKFFTSYWQGIFSPSLNKPVWNHTVNGLVVPRELPLKAPRYLTRQKETSEQRLARPPVSFDSLEDIIEYDEATLLQWRAEREAAEENNRLFAIRYSTLPQQSAPTVEAQEIARLQSVRQVANEEFDAIYTGHAVPEDWQADTVPVLTRIWSQVAHIFNDATIHTLQTSTQLDVLRLETEYITPAATRLLAWGKNQRDPQPLGPTGWNVNLVERLHGVVTQMQFPHSPQLPQKIGVILEYLRLFEQQHTQMLREQEEAAAQAQARQAAIEAQQQELKRRFKENRAQQLAEAVAQPEPMDIPTSYPKGPDEDTPMEEAPWSTPAPAPPPLPEAMEEDTHPSFTSVPSASTSFFRSSTSSFASGSASTSTSTSSFRSSTSLFSSASTSTSASTTYPTPPTSFHSSFTSFPTRTLSSAPSTSTAAPNMRLFLKTKDARVWRINKITTSTPVANVLERCRAAMELGAEQRVTLVFDDVKLSEDGLVGDYGIEDEDSLEVHVK